MFANSSSMSRCRGSTVPERAEHPQAGRRAPGFDTVGFPVSWERRNTKGIGALTVGLPDGPFTTELALTDLSAVERVLVSIAPRVSTEQLQELRMQLIGLASEVQGVESAAKPSSSMRDQIVQLVLEDDAVELFHDADDASRVFLAASGPEEAVECFDLTRAGVGDWLFQACFRRLEQVPSESALNEAISALAAEARFNGRGLPVGLRTAEVGKEIFVDLASDRYEVVQVQTDGWQLVPSGVAPVRFPKRKHARPLPDPQGPGGLGELRPLVNIRSADEWVLFTTVLVAYLAPCGPYPVMMVTGEQGSAKSSLSRVVQELVDPNQGAIRRPPKNEHDLVLAAVRSHLLVFDNLSGLSASMSDAICALATGAGFGTRKLYTDDEEVVFSAQRPVVLNGIDDLDERADLLDRAVLLNLQAIPPSERLTEAALRRRLDAVLPGAFSALLDALSAYLRLRDEVAPPDLPRMADFACLGVAVEGALGHDPGSFLAAYERNRGEAQLLALARFPLCQAVVDLTREKRAWEGTASSLLSAARVFATPAVYRGPLWPASASAVGKQLRRCQASLRGLNVGVDVGARDRSPSRNRLIRLEWLGVSDEEGELQCPDNGVLDMSHDDQHGTCPGIVPPPGPEKADLDMLDMLDGPSFLEKEEGGDGGGPRIEGFSNTRPSCPTCPDDAEPVSQAAGHAALGAGSRRLRCFNCGSRSHWRRRAPAGAKSGDWLCASCCAPRLPEDAIERLDSAGGAA